MGNLLIILGNILYYVFQIYSWILLGRVVVSWVGADPHNPIVLLLHRLTDPFLRRIARYFPQLQNLGGFDWTPLVLFVVLILLQYIVAIPIIRLGESLNMQ